MTFSQRKRFMDSLQRQVRKQHKAAVAWPDVFWFVTPLMLMRAAEEIRKSQGPRQEDK